MAYIHRVQSDDFLVKAAQQNNPQEEALAQRVSSSAGESSVLPNTGILSAMQATIDSDALLYPVLMEGEPVYLKVEKNRSYHPCQPRVGEYTDFESYLTPVLSLTSYYSRGINLELHPVPMGFVPRNREGVPIDPPLFEEIDKQEPPIRIFRSSADDEMMFVGENPERVPYQPVEYSRYKAEWIRLPDASGDGKYCDVVDSHRLLYPVCIKGQRVYHEMEPVFSYPTYYFQRKTKGKYIEGKKEGDHWKLCAVAPNFTAYNSKGIQMKFSLCKYRKDETSPPIKVPRYSFSAEKLYADKFPLYSFDDLLYYLNPNPSSLRSINGSDTRVCFQNPNSFTRDSFSELRAVDEPFVHLCFNGPISRFTCLSFDGLHKIVDVTAPNWKEELKVWSKEGEDVLLFKYHRNGEFWRLSKVKFEHHKELPVSRPKIPLPRYLTIESGASQNCKVSLVSRPSQQSIPRNPSEASLASQCRSRSLSQESIDDALKKHSMCAHSSPAGAEVVVDKAGSLHKSVNNG